MNNRITAKTVQVINFDGQNMGAMPIAQALQIASDAGLDLAPAHNCVWAVFCQ